VDTYATTLVKSVLAPPASCVTTATRRGPWQELARPVTTVVKILRHSAQQVPTLFTARVREPPFAHLCHQDTVSLQETTHQFGALRVTTKTNTVVIVMPPRAIFARLVTPAPVDPLLKSKGFVREEPML
jgi:hypothetical protein